MSNYSLNIVHLYPDLLDLYGDKGNILSMKKRFEWRGIEANIQPCTKDNEEVDFETADIVFLGGGSDREQELVCSKLAAHKDEIKKFVESDGVLIAACGGFHMLGTYYASGEKKADGLGILNIQTDLSDGRLIGDVVLESSLTGDMKIIGFENHAGRVNINDYTPLGSVIHGNGNDGKSGFEGVVYKNVYGTNLHGPLFPKNPKLCDYILKAALKRKYSDFGELEPLDDTLENMANDYMVNRFLNK